MISLIDAKEFLNVIHSCDDVKLIQLLAAAEDEAMQFMARDDFSDIEGINEGECPGSAQIGILLMLQANYQASPDDQVQLRSVAETKLMPFRCGLGV